MSDEYAFWHAQLAGEEPETTPGVPHAGFFMGGSSGAAYKKHVPPSYIAIWQEDGEWTARIDQEGQPTKIMRGWQVDEFVFPRCCRNAIPYEQYLAGVEHEPR